MGLKPRRLRRNKLTILKKIKNNPDLKARIISALQAGGISALESLIDHPAATFVVAALEDWRNTSN